MKRVGILTYFSDFPYFNDINPGMNLQAMSVYRVLSSLLPNCKVEFIRYHSWWAVWRPYISGMTISSFLQDIRQLFKYYDFSKGLPKSGKVLVSKNREKSLQFIDGLGYDAIYVGSDTLLELFRCNEDEISAYWLNNTVKARKFMVAASGRDTSFQSLSSIQRKLIKGSIESFLKLGVRDRATFDLIEEVLGRTDERLMVVPDPTFSYVINYDIVAKYAKKSGLCNIAKPIVCFHLLKDSTYATSLAEMFKKNGFIVASLRPAKYADIIIKDLSPEEFAGIFKYFDLVITHRFHDTIFCIKNLCPVLLFQPSRQYENLKGDSKQSSLMDLFGLVETNFIQDISTMTDIEIFEKMNEAKISFSNKKDEITIKLKELDVEFKNYIKDTIRLNS